MNMCLNTLRLGGLWSTLLLCLLVAGCLKSQPFQQHRGTEQPAGAVALICAHLTYKDQKDFGVFTDLGTQFVSMDDQRLRNGSFWRYSGYSADYFEIAPDFIPST